MLQKNLKVMDSTAISLCMDNELPIVVFDLTERGQHPPRRDSARDIGTMVGKVATRAA